MTQEHDIEIKIRKTTKISQTHKTMNKQRQITSRTAEITRL